MESRSCRSFFRRSRDQRERYPRAEAEIVRQRILLAAIACVLATIVNAHAQHVVAASGDSVVLSSGSDAGVRQGMTGKICAQETVGGRTVTNCSARFVVTSVSEGKSTARITKGDASSAKGGAAANFDETLSPKPKERKSERRKPREQPKHDEAADFLRDADRAFRDGDYRGALERYQNFLHAYPDHDKADFAADRIDASRAKLAPPPAAAAAPAVNTPVQPAAATPAPTVAALPAPPPAEMPAAIRQADGLATTAEQLFQGGQLNEARATALQALRIDSTNSRARNTLRAVQVKSVQSRFNAPADVAVSAAGCYVADAGNNTIRIITADGSATVAGASGQHGSESGPAAHARFNAPEGVAAAPDGTIYICDRYNSIIRKITADHVVTTVAGRAGLTGRTDGAALSARFNGPRRIAVAADGTIYVADTDNHAVRRILPAGTVETVVAPSESDRMDPIGIAVDAEGNVLVADAWTHVIRKIDPAGRMSIVAGLPGVSGSVDGPVGSARFNAPEGVAVDSDGAIYVADTGNHTIRKIVNGLVTTAAGRAGLADAVDGSGSVARLNRPSGIRCDTHGRLWIADSGNHAVRIMTDGFVETAAGLAGTVGSSDGSN
jgi:sugar lactone lactonase YvrE